ncbi:hypothetical protein [Cellulomonas xylanilytica]|uniref:Uncharacterized protein n=1 Tax=Cellulomonas xylanilytica TaxID=233583 RepID=A0A510UZ19_9CELL|nr:hypothetical protein [Cellulomonas xylanilytica]GEK19912.1 hypothetical protein CXY01_04320 [Cellulomonas xylanilytica]
MAATPHPEPEHGGSVVRNRASLLQMLDDIDREGWDGPTGTTLLTYLRERVVRPLAISVGLRGAAASQAESTAWQALWVELTKPGLRHATSPWGVLGQVARRQLLGEIVAARFATNDRRAWKLEVASREGTVGPAISLDLLLEAGWEPVADETDPGNSTDDAGLETAARRALVLVGWNEQEASSILSAVLEAPGTRVDDRTRFPGWRAMASSVGIPAWQARRLTIALRGTSDWPGVLARIVAEGPQVIDSPVVRTALMATRRHSYRSPVLAARNVEEALADALPQRRVG